MFLSGGTALGAFHLGHRRSTDLDPFTHDGGSYDALVRQFLRLLDAEPLTVAAGPAGPGFRRFVVSDDNEKVPVDLVHDTAQAIAAPITTPEGLSVDSLDDIGANKWCAILGRSELRDYVDLFFLAKAGKDPLGLLPAAQKKDAGLDPAVLAFVLSEVKVNEAPQNLDQPLSAQEHQSFIDDLRHRLARAAFPRDT